MSKNRIKVLFLGFIFVNLFISSAQASVAPVKKSKAHFDASAKIDKMLADYWKTNGVEPRPYADDSTFLRRAYLDLIGRVPTNVEVGDFLHSSDKNKRSKVIDQLLDSEGYVSHQFNFWADLLRVQNDYQQGGENYIKWVKQSIRENKPYDEFVRELLSALGLPWEDGAVGYYLRDRGMPLDNMSNTTRVFLGTRMECAQCHDDPFDKWTQKDYFQFAALRYPVNTKSSKNGLPEMAVLQKHLKSRKLEKPMYKAVNDALQNFNYRVDADEKRELRYPDDYQYDNAKAKGIAEPKFIFGESEDIAALKGHARTEGFIDWLVSPDNERFATVIANRMWKRVVGAGLIEPVDQMKDETVAASPELMKYLTSLMISQGYDMKQFLRVLYNTDVYQRATCVQNVQDFTDFRYTGPVLRRMTAEQIWDSFMTLAVPNIDHVKKKEKKGGYGGKRLPGEEFHRYMAAHTVDEVADFLVDYAKLEMKASAAGREANTIRLKNNDYKTDKAYLKKRAEMTHIREQQKKMVQGIVTYEEVAGADDIKLSDETAGPRRMNAKEYKKQLMDAGMPKDEMYAAIKVYQKKESRLKGIMSRFKGGTMRASELPSPAPAGHFLSEFGQSDREVIDNGNTEANMGGVLMFMNSPLINDYVMQNSLPVWTMDRESDPEDKLDSLYLGFLSRYPTELEKEKLMPLLADTGNRGQDRIVWSLLNSKQFMFIQ